ncbi:hypothetical protein BLNAU_15287 [Blattamonas nauphoetae]|uniref:Protein kinase domain-containing protein n=1 Tax=Blattamonas nauphoetae TaxID=2049346 RepID=A0ABQ9XEI7_9EUKA|nr:hypothetical protein BLNAU_15287 [Blattamonas nauphoetae]
MSINTLLLILSQLLTVQASQDQMLKSLSLFLKKETRKLNENGNKSIPLLMEGHYIGNKIDISDETIELSGSSSAPSRRTRIEIGGDLISPSGSKNDEKMMNRNAGTDENYLFWLQNSSLLLKSLVLSLVDNFEETGRSGQKNEDARLAIVSDSMLRIADSVVAVSGSSSAIVISSPHMCSPTMATSVVVENSQIWNDVGAMRGVVETCRFGGAGGSRSISIVGCSFDSHAILGKDGIGLSLTGTPRKSEGDIGRLSSSLIDCSFVNMSSIGSSHLPHAPHLNQKMLGCVVSLTSSHLSGSTIRDMNDGGSVLCSNSSFSSLLSSPHDNTDPSIILPDGDKPVFSSSDKFVIASSSGLDSSSASFSHCHFVSDPTPSPTRPLSFNSYPGSVTVHSCSFTNAVLDDHHGGALYILLQVTPATNEAKIENCNFTDCSAKELGGGLYLLTTAVVTVTGCRCEGCSLSTHTGGQSGGGMYLRLTSTPSSTVRDLYFEGCSSTSYGGGLAVVDVKIDHILTSLSFKWCSATNLNGMGVGGGMHILCSVSNEDIADLLHLKFEDCSARNQGGGLGATLNSGSLSLTDCKFSSCNLTGSGSGLGMGGGLFSMISLSTLSMTRCQFIDCESHTLGGAVLAQVCGFQMLNCSVEQCHTESTGAVCIMPLFDSPITLTNTLFVGNTVSDNPTYFDMMGVINAVQFADFHIEDQMAASPTDVTISNCWTTSPISAGMYSMGMDYTRVFNDAFQKMGPYLTEKVEASLDVVSGRIDVTVRGKVPLESQIYQVTLKEADGESQMTGQLKFSGGVGSLQMSSNLKLHFSTSYTITSIVGVIPTGSVSNDISITTEAWAFNRAGSLDPYSFTTPAEPPTLVASSAHLTEKSQPFAFIIVMFDREVSGSYEIVVEEGGKDEKITVTVDGTSFEGESQTMRVVGEDRVLTHDTTYTIKSIVPSEGNEMVTTVWMNKTITFTIPESLFVPPEDPKDPTDPEPEDPNGKKALSPETKALLSWLIPLVACLLLAVLVLIVVVVLVNRRKKNNQQAQEEMQDQVQFQVEDKMEVVDPNSTNQIIHSDGKSHSAFNSSSDRLPNANNTQEGMKSQTETECVEVMTCSGGFEISAAPITNTLYSVLHKEHKEIGKRIIGMQIVSGLKQVVANRGWSDVLTRLSSHWILIDASGNVQLKLQMNASEAEQEATQTQVQNPNMAGNGNEQNVNERSEPTRHSGNDKSGMDGLRWRAPEVVGSKGGHVDGHKASVFSLGLILWEIETGQVPFGELDAVNAQRQSGTGTPPKMESLKDEEFITLIHRCVSVDPEQRPTLTEVGEFLSSHPDETIGGSGNEMKE